MHTSELRWSEVGATVSNVAEGLIEVVNRAEERYQELLEAYQFAGGTDEAFADLLFRDAGVSPVTQEMVDRARDVRLAMVAAHDAFVALDFAALRRMS